MMSRYFIVVQIPPEVVELIRSYFRDKFHKEMTATHIHMSLLPPFYLNENIDEVEMLRIVKGIEWKVFEAKFDGVRKSEQRDRKYLFLNVVPEQNCKQLSKVIENSLNSSIAIDKKPYLNDVVPPFEAHVTIDYNFEGDVPEDFPEFTFKVDKISVAKEVNGQWVDLV